MSFSATVNTCKSEIWLVEMLNYLDGQYRSDIAGDIREGLTASQKFIPCKYFYDAHGSKLFEKICRLPEYYPTRTEMSILSGIAPELMKSFVHKDLVEFGPGANWKICILLDAADRSNRATLRYIPVDISESALLKASQDLCKRYPELQVLVVVADFTSQLDVLPAERPAMFCFLGSTIGNFEEDECIEFLQSISKIMKPDDRLIVGFDMVKAREIIEAAYNDSLGITSEFNKNVLNVLNNRLNANFDPFLFDHLAFYNKDYDRIEMHLKAKCDISVNLKSIELEVEIERGETIHTENSRKFTKKSIEDMAGRAGLSIKNWYSDPDAWFSVVLMGSTS